MNTNFDGALVMPSSYVEVEQREMEYIESGYNKSGVKYDIFGNRYIYFNYKETRTLIKAADGPLPKIASLCLAFVPGMGGIFAAGLAAIISIQKWQVEKFNRDGSGIILYTPRKKIGSSSIGGSYIFDQN